MEIAPEVRFHCEVEEIENAARVKATLVKCHGRLTNATVDQLKDTVKPLIARAGHIILDFGDLAWMDSSGLGAVVGLKVSTMNKFDQCTLELVNLSPRVRELLSLSNLIQMFTVKPHPGSAFSYHLSALHPTESDKSSDK